MTKAVYRNKSNVCSDKSNVCRDKSNVYSNTNKVCPKALCVEKGSGCVQRQSMKR